MFYTVEKGPLRRIKQLGLLTVTFLKRLLVELTPPKRHSIRTNDLEYRRLRTCNAFNDQWMHLTCEESQCRQI